MSTCQEKRLLGLGHAPHASVADDADGHASRQASQATGQAGRQVCVAIKQVVRLVGRLVDCATQNNSAQASLSPTPSVAILLKPHKYTVDYLL